MQNNSKGNQAVGIGQEGAMDAQTDRQTDKCVLNDFGLLGAAAQKVRRSSIDKLGPETIAGYCSF